MCHGDHGLNLLDTEWSKNTEQNLHSSTKRSIYNRSISVPELSQVSS